MEIGDVVLVDTFINGYLKGVIVHKHEKQNDVYNVDVYNVKIVLGEYGEVVEAFSAKRIKKI